MIGGKNIQRPNEQTKCKDGETGVYFLFIVDQNKCRFPSFVFLQINIFKGITRRRQLGDLFGSHNYTSLLLHLFLILQSSSSSGELKEQCEITGNSWKYVVIFNLRGASRRKMAANNANADDTMNKRK